MSNPYRQTRNELMAAVVQRAADGQSLTAACALPGMPSRSAVWKWTRVNAAFADALTQARRAAQGRRVAFDEGIAATLVARVAAGQRIRDILADPAMPSHSVYRRWRAQQGHFAAELYRLEGVAAAQHGARRAEAAARPFDPQVADRIYASVLRGAPLKATLRADPSLPSYQVVCRWRRERPQFDRLMAFAISRQRGLGQRARGGPTEALIEAIAARVVEGAALAEVARQPRMPSLHTLYAWKRRRPEFAEAIAGARAARLDCLEDQILVAAEQATPQTVRSARRTIAALKKRAWHLRRKAREGALTEAAEDAG